MKTELDPKNQELLARRIQAREKIDGPRMGDYVLFSTGELERIGVEIGKGYQTTPCGSFYLFPSGHANCSGSFHPIVDASTLQLSSVQLQGVFWFFDHDVSGAGRGVTFKIPCQVFTTTAPYKGYLGKEFQTSEMEERKKELINLISDVLTKP